MLSGLRGLWRAGSAEKTKWSPVSSLARRQHRGAPLPMLGKKGNGLHVERDATHLVGLRVLVHIDATHDHVASSQVKDAALQVDVPPAQCGELAAAHPCDHDQPDEHAPLVVLVE